MLSPILLHIAAPSGGKTFFVAVVAACRVCIDSTIPLRGKGGGGEGVCHDARGIVGENEDVNVGVMMREE